MLKNKRRHSEALISCRSKLMVFLRMAVRNSSMNESIAEVMKHMRIKIVDHESKITSEHYLVVTVKGHHRNDYYKFKLALKDMGRNSKTFKEIERHREDYDWGWIFGVHCRSDPKLIEKCIAELKSSVKKRKNQHNELVLRKRSPGSCLYSGNGFFDEFIDDNYMPQENDDSDDEIALLLPKTKPLCKKIIFS